MGSSSWLPEEVEPLRVGLPGESVSAVKIVRTLAEAGHVALLAGGCVRDLLLGESPQDYDVATDAPPDRVCELFRATRRVGVQFGVVLVRKRGRWVEVATFRSDGRYLDGRRPTEVHFTTARYDAQRRDFTINGMFLDPLGKEIVDLVGGRQDLRAGVVRAIGVPAERFGEDHLRLLRAVRFAARLGFALESETRSAIEAQRADLERVAAERVREELEKMLRDRRRGRAVRLLRETGLLWHLVPGIEWNESHLDAVEPLIGSLPAGASAELVLAMLLSGHGLGRIEAVGRSLTLSNAQLGAVCWLVEHRGDLDDPDGIGLAALKRLMAHEAFPLLVMWAEARYSREGDGTERSAALFRRLDGIAPEAVRPKPFVTGAELAASGVEAGPVYREILEELYTRQLSEELQTYDEAIEALRGCLRSRGLGRDAL